MTRTDGNPIELFRRWYREACDHPAIEVPEAMCVSTVDADGLPDARFVLLKTADERGFTFYTNTASPKGRQLRNCPYVALTFYWEKFRRQVRVRGKVEPVSNEEADEYFASRARLSRLGAWASRQSEVLKSRFTLLRRVARFTRKFGVGDIPRPEFWSGYRVIPDRIEFWHEEAFRLNDRRLYVREPNGEWSVTRLYP